MALSRYFGGSSVTGPVRSSSARNFREVVEALRVCPTLSIARSALLAMSEAERSAAKHVPFFVAACFRNSPGPRDYAHATHCNLIFLDIDPEKEKRDGKWVETGRFPAAPFTETPENLYKALAGFNFAAYTTASHTPEKPRMRVVVDAENLSLEEYRHAVAEIAARLGLPSITRESKVCVQPMFLPTLFAGESEEEDHPVIAWSLDGRAFTSDDIQNGPLSLTGGTEKAPAKRSTASTDSADSLDALDYLRAPVPEVTLAIAREMLFALDADCSRSEWLESAAALKHQFSPRAEDEAFALFDEWSAKGTKYGGEEETRKMWDSLKQTPAGRMPVTVRSLLKQAVSAGWNDREVKESIFASTVDWMESGAPNATALIEGGAKKIVAVPMLSAVQEDVLISQLCAQVKKRFAYSITSASIRKDIARLREIGRTQEKPPESSREPIWVKGVCYVSQTSEFFRPRTGEKISKVAFDDIYGRHLLPTPDDLMRAGIPVNPATMSKPIVSPSDHALHGLKVPTVHDYAYVPSQPSETIFVSRGVKYVNSYSSQGIPELDHEHKELAGKTFQGHMHRLIAELSYGRYMIHWLCYQVQFPGRKIRWAPLIQSCDGAGKTYLAEVMKAVLGKRHVQVINGEAVKKGWNEWATGSQLVVLEEVRVVGTNRHEIMNTLKELITNDDIPVNQRGRDTRQTENVTNYMLFSNHHDALALTAGDRRYFVIKSPLQTKAAVMALGENGYFENLFGMLQKYPGALRAWMLDWPIPDDFNPNGHAPRTTYLTDMVADGACDLTAAIRRLIAEGDYPLIQSDLVSTKAIMDVLTTEEGLSRVSAQQVSRCFREEGFIQHGRHLIGDTRHYLWVNSALMDKEQDCVKVAAERLKNGVKKADGIADALTEAF